MKKYYWVFPLILLIGLLVAPYFRWETTTTKTTDKIIYKWKTDRWSHTNWKETYFLSGFMGGFVEEQISSPNIIMQRDEATKIWKNTTTTVFIITLLAWLAPIIIEYRKKKETLKQKG
ncbi:MAG: hypothetical protein A4E53_00091 [Pelotomaculum sp. PtaB.Bin104]|nr:MAG: hypothetical protein A4E53_00091 [Pelotomaculum sp. PtaB.Bin104]